MFKYKLLKKEYDDFINYGWLSREEILDYIFRDDLRELEIESEGNREKKWNEDIAFGISSSAFGEYVAIVTYEGEW
jgi:hypothetical protein